MVVCGGFDRHPSDIFHFWKRSNVHVKSNSSMYVAYIFYFKALFECYEWKLYYFLYW